jgi:hypothetical protein
MQETEEGTKLVFSPKLILTGISPPFLDLHLPVPSLLLIFLLSNQVL